MKKGQAAMEFLMTYGWAILVVLAAIGALAYFGVLSPDRFLPSKCVANPPFSCGEFKVDSAADTITFGLQANAGVDLTDVVVNVTCDGANYFDLDVGTATDPATATAVVPQRLGTNGWTNGGEMIVTLWPADLGNDAAADAGCDDTAATADLAAGDRIKMDMLITYRKAGEGVTHTTTGSLQARVE